MEQHTVIFLAALSLAILMFWYLGTENPVSKRWVGTVLSVGLSVLCLLGIVPPDRDHLGKIPDALSGKAPWSEVAKLQAGIDIAGGSAFALQLQPSPGRAVDQSSQDKAIEVVRKRLNDLGNKDLSIARRGSDQIVLQMPGVKEADRVQIRETLQKAAKLDFHLVHRESKTLLPKVEAGDLVPGYEVKEVKEKDKSGAVKHDDKVVVTKLPDFEGKYVNRAQPYNNPNKGWVVLLDFDSDGRKLFGDLTGAHVGERLAIVLDGEIVSAPTIQDAITSGNCEISGMGSAEAALNLANALNNPLENSMQIIEEQSVSATLGAAAVHQGVLAGIAGLVVVLLFMMAYYRISGFIAFLALVVNLLVLVGIMAMFQFSFTLPGIAGIVLTVGMAVDSNVLIYERLKEELALGKSVGAAIEAAFDKAFSAIFDANITTLLTGVVLFWLATDAVRGFAVTLVCGILGTLFAALVVTRVCYRWMIDTGHLQTLSIGKPMRNRGINFLGLARTAFFISTALILVSIGAMVFRGNDALNVDFKGGSLITFEGPAATAPKVEEVQKAVDEVGLKTKAAVQRLASAVGSADRAQIQIRAEEGSGGKVVEHLRQVIPTFSAKEADGKFTFGDSTISVGATLGKELLKGSGWAVLIGLGLILVYLAMRYELSFAIAAVVALIHDLTITVGVMLVCGREMSAVMVAALLTIAGYSVNDTIIVFDRIREELHKTSADVETIMNRAMNETLSRTILTSLLTLFTVVCMAVFGGSGLLDFSLSMCIGIVVGTYSSIYVASALVLWWTKVTGRSLRQQVIETETRRASVQKPA